MYYTNLLQQGTQGSGLPPQQHFNLTNVAGQIQLKRLKIKREESQPREPEKYLRILSPSPNCRPLIVESRIQHLFYKFECLDFCKLTLSLFLPMDQLSGYQMLGLKNSSTGLYAKITHGSFFFVMGHTLVFDFSFTHLIQHHIPCAIQTLLSQPHRFVLKQHH